MKNLLANLSKQNFKQTFFLYHKCVTWSYATASYCWLKRSLISSNNFTKLNQNVYNLLQCAKKRCSTSKMIKKKNKFNTEVKISTIP